MDNTELVLDDLFYSNFVLGNIRTKIVDENCNIYKGDTIDLQFQYRTLKTRTVHDIKIKHVQPLIIDLDYNSMIINGMLLTKMEQDMVVMFEGFESMDDLVESIKAIYAPNDISMIKLKILHWHFKDGYDIQPHSSHKRGYRKHI
ncbi:hypothetical protein [Winogradskyella sp.]|uniref:hypothetical protein n=1 Tax=Winogradskyella sp. TaxID=1883156 RepID=UPI0026301E0E|nr:hypothetical protein [Winogradskyella sp.]